MNCPICNSRALMRDYAPGRSYAFLIFGALMLVFSRLILPAIYPLFVIKNMDTNGHSPLMFVEGIDYAIKQLTIIGAISAFLGVLDIFRNQNKFCLKCGFKGRFIKKKFDEKTAEALSAFRSAKEKDDKSAGGKIVFGNQPIKPLIKMLSFKDEGKRKDALDTLCAITGADFGYDQKAWEEWFENSKNLILRISMVDIIDNKLLQILVCPLSKKLVQEGNYLICKEADPMRRYPVRDGIPVMLADESEILDKNSNWVREK